MQEGSYNFYFGSSEYDDSIPLKCNCTKGSNKSGCDNNGICVVDDKRNAACLMLYSPERGIHYGCANKKLSEDSCTFKTTKLNNKALVCACSRGNFCNFYKWPNYSALLEKFKNNPDFIQNMTPKFHSINHTDSKHNHSKHNTSYHKHLIHNSDIKVNKTLYAQKIMKKYQDMNSNSTYAKILLYTYIQTIVFYIIVYNII
uniref:Dickkopf_N domain-containing protein n=1 Tax=Strongyloides venezuelensis TaxID=75913 RepID=A0A0K0G0F5_STRVS